MLLTNWYSIHPVLKYDLILDDGVYRGTDFYSFDIIGRKILLLVHELTQRFHDFNIVVLHSNLNDGLVFLSK